MIQVYFITDRHKLEHPLFGITEQELHVMNNLPKGVLPDIDPYGDTMLYIDHINFISDNIQIWGIERSGFFNGREKWAKGFENQRV